MSDGMRICELLEQILAELRKRPTAPSPARSSNGTDAAKAVADDADLDSQYGDFEVRYKARGWDGEDFKGQRVSECPVEFLEVYAEQLDYIARSAAEKGEKTKSGADRAPLIQRDAARVRGWIRRKQQQDAAATVGADDNVGVTDDLPF